MGKKKKQIKLLKSKIYFLTAIIAILVTGGLTISSIAYADLETCKQIGTRDAFYDSQGPVGFVLKIK